MSEKEREEIRSELRSKVKTITDLNFAIKFLEEASQAGYEGLANLLYMTVYTVLIEKFADKEINKRLEEINKLANELKDYISDLSSEQVFDEKSKFILNSLDVSLESIEDKKKKEEDDEKDLIGMYLEAATGQSFNENILDDSKDQEDDEVEDDDPFGFEERIDNIKDLLGKMGDD